MKKIFTTTILLFLFGTALTKGTHAQTPSASLTPTAPPKTKQIEDLKERLATKVAELRNLQPKAIYGKVKSQTVSSMTIETKTKDIKIELTDGIKVFQYLKGVRSKLTTDDVDNGDFVVVFGQYDSTIDILKATVILIDNSPKEVWINGVVKSRDEEEFTITLTASDSLEYLVDVEKTTKVSNWNGTLIEKSGFSKVAVGDTVHIIGTPAQNKEKRLSAKRIIDLGKLMPSPTLAPEISASDTESTPSPKASPKSSPAPRAASPTPRPTVSP